MTNANDPIVQTVYRQTGEKSYRPATEKEIKEGIYLVHREGLTKREHFAAMAMSGLLANYKANDDSVNDGWPFVAGKAIMCADALIEELNKSEPTDSGVVE
jgi:hypothetical protein